MNVYGMPPLHSSDGGNPTNQGMVDHQESQARALTVKVCLMDRGMLVHNVGKLVEVPHNRQVP